ncbi:MAG: MOSC N-terminal beta barrel domain-containing protein [Ilumatobacter sp.]|uniref:MOSC domain-containing protein n=1 Tax=Ilumatobacter sp. TaxID=1967498 RepID=UPI00329A34BA
MRVNEIWRFPVKSVGGEVLRKAEVTELGVDGDRAWSIFDVATGNTLTARRTPELLFASARVVDGELAITLPDGAEVGQGDHAALSAWLGRNVELRAAADHNVDVGGTYECPIGVADDAEWVSWQGPGGAFHDSTRSRVSLVSESTLGDWDRRRFRTNIVTDGSGEDAFVGSSVTIGDVGDRAVRLDVVKQIDRCVMVTRPQPHLGRDLDVLKTINAERATFLAVGGLVTEVGTIAVGDEVRLG